jgi:hypothetical protein
VIKQTTHRVHTERLNSAEGKEQYKEISNRFTALETYMMTWILIELGILLETKCQPKKVYVIMI